MGLKSRVTKLEAKLPEGKDAPIILRRIVGAHNGKPSGKSHYAYASGPEGSRVFPQKGESDAVFLERIATATEQVNP